VDVILEWVLKFIKQKNKQSRKQKKKAKKEGKDSSAKTIDNVVIADFGCGDAKLAKEILSSISTDSEETEIDKDIKSKSKKLQKEKNKGEEDKHVKVHSFDLVSGGNPLITPCDMTNVPLKENTVDVAVFSLALMGINVADFIREAHRVLRSDGILKIAEVRSRFESTNASSSDDKDKSNPRKMEQNSSDQNKIVDLSNLSEFIEVMLELGFHCKNMDRSNQMFVMFDFEKNGKDPKKDVHFSLRPCIYKRR